MSKKLFCLLVLLGFLSKVLAQEKILLVNKGKSVYKIVIPYNANEIEKQSAVVLQDYLKKISGCTLPIVAQDPSNTAPQIIIGRSKMIAENELKDLGDDGFIIKKINNSLMLAGGQRKGTLYSVYTFLEDYLGCRMYTSRAIHIPHKSSISMPAVVFRKEVPSFAYRTTFFTDALSKNENYCDFHKMNFFLENWGLWVHSYKVLLPPEKHFKINPEYYALVSGKRNEDQLCLSNSTVEKLVIENLKKLIKEDPNKKYWSVSQNDNDNLCECDNCKRLNDEQSSYNGSVLRFANNVARYFPDKIITTLAYRKTETPPKTLKPLSNVLIMLCTAYDERRKPLEQQTNVGFYSNFKNWAALTPELFIWDYIVPFAHALSPFPNYYTIQPNVQYFASRNVKKIFLNGIGDFPGEFSELRCYLVSRIMWNKDVNVKATMREFINGYYGKAGGTLISRYISLLNYNASLHPVGLRSGGGPTDAINSYLSLNSIYKYKSIFEDALNATKGTVYNSRIMKEYLSVLYAELEISKATISRENKTAKAKKNNLNENLLENFYKKMKQLNLTWLNESWLTVDDYYKNYSDLISKEKR